MIDHRPTGSMDEPALYVTGPCQRYEQEVALAPAFTDLGGVLEAQYGTPLRHDCPEAVAVARWQ